MFDTILIANRGEIACRIARSARLLGMRSVAVYSDADAGALHVAAADDAVRIGTAPATDSYLRADRIVEAALETGAQAIHPGYGFLSENAEFAQACAKAGLVFVGPPANAIRAMGSKRAAKALMEKAGVPVVPGYHGKTQGPKTLRAAADRIGYPVLIKASAGGGGRGMRRVDRARDFDAALAGARREAKASFGDDTMLIEKFVAEPRHIELQVFADAHGNVVHLFERDCSIQRRHQKVIEEAPAPGLSEERRAAMGAAAVEAARAVGYVGAGTVEFIVCGDGAFYFMEMNTRLQVEHPVTELITGIDLVEWQFRVAAGEELPLDQDAIRATGHAIEARIYAEDPARGFLPAPGILHRLRFPNDPSLDDGHRNGGGVDTLVRIDAGVREGDTVTPHYDPMIAKLVVWSEDGRAGAVRRLRRALAETRIAGTANNVAFLSAVAAHPAFGAGTYDTGFIEDHADTLMPGREPASAETLACAALAVELRRQAEAEEGARASHDATSPWHLVNGWRLNDDGAHVLNFSDGGEERAVGVTYLAEDYCLALPDGSVVQAAGALDGDRLIARLDDRTHRADVAFVEGDIVVWLGGKEATFAMIDPLAGVEGLEVEEDRLSAPMSGKVIEIAVKAGDRLTRGQAILVVEAMKMEHTITAPADGVVRKLMFGVGDQVEEGAQLVDFERGDP